MLCRQSLPGLNTIMLVSYVVDGLLYETLQCAMDDWMDEIF